MYCNGWDEITYSFSNVNGCIIEVWEWISNFIPHFIMDIITYPCWDWSNNMLAKSDPGHHCACRCSGTQQHQAISMYYIDCKGFPRSPGERFTDLLQNTILKVPHSKPSLNHWDAESYFLHNITMTSLWARLRLKSPASGLFTQPFIRAQIKVNIKAPRHWPLCGEFTGDRWIPRTNGQ